MAWKCSFSENSRVWIFVCKWLGLFPYDVVELSYKKKEYYKLHVLRCLIVFLSAEVLFSAMKYHVRYFGQIFFIVDISFMVFWLLFWLKNNDRLIELFLSLDRHDDLFRVMTGKRIKHKKMFQIFSINVLICLFFFDFIKTVIIGLSDFNQFGSVIFDFVKLVERSIILIFVTLYLYIIYCLKQKFESLFEWWQENVETKTEKALLFHHLTVKVENLKLLYSNLSNVVDSMNKCLGSRFVILYGQLFYLILTYFYALCTGLIYVLYFLPFYICTFLLATLSSQSLLNTADFAARFLKISTRKMPERLLFQVCGFVQQLRMNPLNINANGFFEINQQFLFSMTISVASYLIAIFQLVPLLSSIASNTVISLI